MASFLGWLNLRAETRKPTVLTGAPLGPAASPAADSPLVCGTWIVSWGPPMGFPKHPCVRVPEGSQCFDLVYKVLYLRSLIFILFHILLMCCSFATLLARGRPASTFVSRQANNIFSVLLLTIEETLWPSREFLPDIVAVVEGWKGGMNTTASFCSPNSVVTKIFLNCSF